MRIWLTRKKQNTTPSTGEPDVTEGWLHPESAQTLLAETTRQQLIQFIRQSTALPASLFERFWLIPIHRFAELAQLFPARKTTTIPTQVACSITASKPPAMPHGCGRVIFFRLMQRRKIRPRSPNAGPPLSSTPRCCTIWVNSSPILKWKILAGNAGFHGMAR